LVAASQLGEIHNNSVKNELGFIFSEIDYCGTMDVVAAALYRRTNAVMAT
jgi:hypothetical protein